MQTNVGRPKSCLVECFFFFFFRALRLEVVASRLEAMATSFFFLYFWFEYV